MRCVWCMRVRCRAVLLIIMGGSLSTEPPPPPPPVSIMRPGTQHATLGVLNEALLSWGGKDLTPEQVVDAFAQSSREGILRHLLIQSDGTHPSSADVARAPAILCHLADVFWAGAQERLSTQLMRKMAIKPGAVSREFVAALAKALADHGLAKAVLSDTPAAGTADEFVRRVTTAITLVSGSDVLMKSVLDGALAKAPIAPQPAQSTKSGAPKLIQLRLGAEFARTPSSEAAAASGAALAAAKAVINTLLEVAAAEKQRQFRQRAADASQLETAVAAAVSPVRTDATPPPAAARGQLRHVETAAIERSRVAQSRQAEPYTRKSGTPAPPPLDVEAIHANNRRMDLAYAASKSGAAPNQPPRPQPVGKLDGTAALAPAAASKSTDARAARVPPPPSKAPVTSATAAGSTTGQLMSWFQPQSASASATPPPPAKATGSPRSTPARPRSWRKVTTPRGPDAARGSSHRERYGEHFILSSPQPPQIMPSPKPGQQHVSTSATYFGQMSRAAPAGYGGFKPAGRRGTGYTLRDEVSA